MNNHKIKNVITLFFLWLPFIAQNQDEKLISLIDTLKKIKNDNFIIEQIHESGTAVLAKSFNENTHQVTIIHNTQGEVLYSENYSKPFWVTSGGPGGFAWMNFDRLEITTFYIDKKAEQSSQMIGTEAHDVKVYKNGIVALYKRINPSKKQFGLFYHNTVTDVVWQDFASKSTLSTLDDAFKSHVIKTSPTKSSMLFDKNYAAQFLFITGYQQSELFNNYLNKDKSHIAVNHAKTSYVLRNKNNLLFHNSLEKKCTIIKIPQSETMLCPIGLHFSFDDTMIFVFFAQKILGYYLIEELWSELAVPSSIQKIDDIPGLQLVFFQTTDHQYFSVKPINYLFEMIEYI